MDSAFDFSPVFSFGIIPRRVHIIFPSCRPFAIPLAEDVATDQHGHHGDLLLRNRLARQAVRLHIIESRDALADRHDLFLIGNDAVRLVENILTATNRIRHGLLSIFARRIILRHIRSERARPPEAVDCNQIVEFRRLNLVNEAAHHVRFNLENAFRLLVRYELPNLFVGEIRLRIEVIDILDFLC